jgi:hypothetical protein
MATWERRRRSIIQPSEEAEGIRSVRWVGEKVARNELPWVSKMNATNSERVESGATPCGTFAVDLSLPRDATLSGVMACGDCLPRVAAQARQPWAD